MENERGGWFETRVGGWVGGWVPTSSPTYFPSSSKVLGLFVAPNPSFLSRKKRL